MKNQTLKLILILALLKVFSVGNAVLAQTTSTVYSEDTVAVNESEYDRMYRLMLADKNKIYTFFKFNAVDWGQLKPSIIIEQNIGGSFNIEPQLRLSAFYWSFPDGIQYAVDAGADLKFYHNYKRRNKLGKRTNGFVGNYLAIGGFYGISDYDDYMEARMIKHGFDAPTLSNFYKTMSAEAKYGMQRRLGTFGYLDVQAGVRYIHYKGNGESIHPFLKVGIGFGLDKEKAIDFIQ